MQGYYAAENVSEEVRDDTAGAAVCAADLLLLNPRHPTVDPHTRVQYESALGWAVEEAKQR